MSDGMGRVFACLSSHATNRYFIPNWGRYLQKAYWFKRGNSLVTRPTNRGLRIALCS